MFVPSMLLRQLYTNASLRNTPTGVTFSLKNYFGIQDDRHRLIDHDWALNRKIADLQHVVQPELVVIEALRAAETDAEKIEILRGQTLTVPRAAEFLARALDDIAASASPALKDVIASKRAYVQKYLDDPTMRGLPPGTRLSPPAFSPR